MRVPIVHFLTSLGDLLSDILSRTGLGIYFGRESGAIDAESLRPVGMEMPLGPRATAVQARAGHHKYLLKRWHDLPADARREMARLLASRQQLRGEGVLEVLAGGEKALDRHSGYVFCVQPFREQTLAQRMQAGPVPLEEASRIIRQIATVLGQAHSMGIIHGSLSPEAVFLDGGQVQVDFVRFSGLEMTQDAAITIMELFPGGRTHLAPESLMGNRPDELSDLYTLGILAYELFTGRPLFELSGVSTTQMVKTILTAQISPPGRYRPDLPNRWEAAILQLLRKERKQRFPDARTFLASVEGV